MTEADAPSGGLPSTHSELIASLDRLLRGWLPRQRWFAGRDRSATGLSLVSMTELLPATASPGLIHLLVRMRQSPPPSANPAARLADCYQLLLGVRETLPPRLAHALIGHPQDGPLAGRAVYEALHDPRLAGLLLERLRTPGQHGVLWFARKTGAEIPAGLTPRSPGADQASSNQSSSMLGYGDRLVLKLFQRVVPGVNPDLELPLALAGRGCGRVPAQVAWFEARAEAGAPGAPLLLGVLRPHLKDAVNGRELALRELAGGWDFSAEARALGRATAETPLSMPWPGRPVRTVPGRPSASTAMLRSFDHVSRSLPQALGSPTSTPPDHGGPQVPGRPAGPTGAEPRTAPDMPR